MRIPLRDGYYLDHRCVLPGNPEQSCKTQGNGRNLRGDGMQRHAGHVRLPGCGILPFLYAGDNLDHSSWDPRSLSGTSRLEDKEKIAMLAFELAVKIEEETK